VSERIRIARELASEYPVRALCELLSVARSSLLYARKPRRDLERLRGVVEHNLVTFPTFGYTRMFKLLQRQRVLCTRSEVRAVYVALNLLGKRAPRRIRTTDSNHSERRYPNLVKDLDVVRPNQLWVADTTYIGVAGRTAYLALVEDAYTRLVLGWSVGFVNDALFVKDSLELALAQGRPEIHHSDQGKPYASATYTNRLLGVGARLSMADAGKAWQNGLAERLNRTFKEEEIRRNEYRSLKEARAAIGAYVDLYNRDRIHMSLGYRTPTEVLESYGRDQIEGQDAP
jgi:putative transposase